MTRYIDTSLLVAALTNEARIDRAQAFLAEPVDDLTISVWTVAEMSSALSIKVRTGQLSEDRRAAAFNAMTADVFTVLQVADAYFRVAARLVERHELGLRAADALHLAVAIDHGATVCTLDQEMASAGTALGASVRLLS